MKRGTTRPTISKEDQEAIKQYFRDNIVKQVKAYNEDPNQLPGYQKSSFVKYPLVYYVVSFDRIMMDPGDEYNWEFFYEWIDQIVKKPEGNDRQTLNDLVRLARTIPTWPAPRIQPVISIRIPTFRPTTVRPTIIQPRIQPIIPATIIRPSIIQPTIQPSIIQPAVLPIQPTVLPTIQPIPGQIISVRPSVKLTGFPTSN